MFGKKSNSNVGKNIRKYRRLHLETQAQLGEYLGYGATTIANYESGYRLPDLYTLQEIADHYNISISKLVN